MNLHQRCLKAKFNFRNKPKQVTPYSLYLSRSQEIKSFCILDSENIDQKCKYHKQLATNVHYCTLLFLKCILKM